MPKIIQLIEPEKGLGAAVLMECVQGDLLKSDAITKDLAREVGSLLAHIHLEHAEGYGDLTDSTSLSDDPQIPFTMKFEEGLEECKGHLPKSLLETCRKHFDKDINLLASADGPCVIHRDFRPGNLIASNGKMRGIIDWSSGRGGFAEDDLIECLIRSCGFVRAHVSFVKTTSINFFFNSRLFSLSRNFIEPRIGKSKGWPSLAALSRRALSRPKNSDGLFLKKRKIFWSP